MDKRSEVSAASAKQGLAVSEHGQAFKQEIIMNNKTSNPLTQSEGGSELADSKATYNAEVKPFIHEQEGSVETLRFKGGSNQERGDQVISQESPQKSELV